ncbi:unnamed protein product [Bursaphelenchus okinawaensis]|uniref:Uncharacterized protein n=1 Tax=Bursaphelenchus okinawaensis TaxID=465554 RepID=A0A811L960_9BILA|nr:unnamed protein product [Bursaphelenchus okinawaensis]CAG9121357.1 unnamed protein product [Bursaphelenchus okinawaensis]
MQCHSCMSPYLEDQFVYISHLYRRPMSFTEKCDRTNFDYREVKMKNCTDLCVTLRMNDKVGGRRRYGFMRGCMSDIKYYNRSVLYYGDSVRRSNDRAVSCQMVRLKDLFAAPDWYGFEPTDHVELCTCHTPLCNSAYSTKFSPTICFGLLIGIYLLGWLFPSRRK